MKGSEKGPSDPVPSLNKGKEKKGDESSSRPLPFGPAPSKEEAEEAISCLQRIICPGSFSGFLGKGLPSTEDNGVSGDVKASSSTAVVSRDNPRTASMVTNQLSQQISDEQVSKAFVCLGIPSFKALACSIACDTGVWAAVLQNEMVQQLWNSCKREAQTVALKYGDLEEAAQSILGWIWSTVKEAVMKFMNKIVNWLSSLLETQSSASPGSPGEGSDTFRFSIIWALIVCVGAWFATVIRRILAGVIAIAQI